MVDSSSCCPGKQLMVIPRASVTSLLASLNLRMELGSEALDIPRWASKTNMADLRSATVIDFTFGLCLLIKAGLSSFPLSTTWVFLGLIGGREVALRFKEKSLDEVFTNRNGGELHQIIGNDIGKASVGVLVSVLFALGLQPLIAWSTG